MNFREKLKEIFGKHNISLSDKQAKDFEKYYENLIKINQIHNLTAITEENDVIYKHFLDSVLPVGELNNNSKILDIGCGAGFPSIPLAIMNNTLRIIAIDSVGKKVDFVNNTAQILDLSQNIQAKHTRIEDLARKSEYREQFDYVVSRAVAPLNIILEYSAPFLKNNGYIISYKGSNYEEELKNSENALKLLNCKLENVKEYSLPDINTTRYVLIIKKIDNISTKYPRGQNKPRTNPL